MIKQADLDRNEIIEMAVLAGLEQDGEMWFSNTYKTDMDVHISHLEAFAKLVDAKATAKEREKLKNVALFDRWYQELDAAVLAEREACANLCDELGEKGYVAEGCAKAIRARGKE